MANNHDSKMKEAQAKEKALNETGSISEVSGWDLIKAGVAKLTNKAAEIKEAHVSSDPKTREQQRYIRNVDRANLRSESGAIAGAVAQQGLKVVDIAYGAAKGIVKEVIPSKPKVESKKDKSKSSKSQD